MLINGVFGNLATATSAHVASRAILCPTNKVVDDINRRCVLQFPGSATTYLSDDTVENCPGQEHLYTSDFLNAIELSGMQPHRLELKVRSFQSDFLCHHCLDARSLCLPAITYNLH